MSTSGLSLEQLQDRGWSFDLSKGTIMRNFASTALCLTCHGHQVRCVTGYGRTIAEARIDAVVAANRWLAESPDVMAIERLAGDSHG